MSGQQTAKLFPTALQCYASLRSSGAHASRFSSLASATAPGRVAVLQSRGVLQAEGPQVLGFLQGIVSNDVRPLEKAGPQQPSVYATILTPKGKFLHDVFIHPHPAQPDAVLIDVDRNGVTAALQLLNRYKLRRPISIRDASADFQVAACWGASSPPQGPWWRPDPRLGELGYRGLRPASEALSGAGALASEEEYWSLRYSLGVAEGETEIPSGQAAPLDYNVDVLRGVSYNKGCYVGQERNSFTHYRGVIRRRLMPVRLEALSSAGATAQTGSSSSAAGVVLPAAGAEVVDASTGRSVGQIRGAAAGSAAGADAQGTGRWGIAYLKLDVALQAAEGREELRVAAPAVGSEAAQAEAGAAVTWRVVPVRPAWWPSEWGREEELAGAGGT